MQKSKGQLDYHPERSEQLWLALVLGVPILLLTEFNPPQAIVSSTSG